MVSVISYFPILSGRLATGYQLSLLWVTKPYLDFRHHPYLAAAWKVTQKVENGDSVKLPFRALRNVIVLRSAFAGKINRLQELDVATRSRCATPVSNKKWGMRSRAIGSYASSPFSLSCSSVRSTLLIRIKSLRARPAQRVASSSLIRNLMRNSTKSS